MLDKRENGGAPVTEAVVPSFTLGEYLAKAGEVIRSSMPPETWVEAVMLEAKLNRGGMKLELIETAADYRRDGRLTYLVREEAMTAIEADLGHTLDVATLTGSRARLRVKPTFHPKWPSRRHPGRDRRGGDRLKPEQV